MAPETTLIGTDSGNYWTGKADAPWTDDPKQAKTYSSPENALYDARDIASAQAKHLDGTALYLDERTDDAPRRRLRVGQDDTPIAFSERWMAAFGTPAPPSLTTPKPERATEPSPTETNEVSQGRERISEDEIRAAVERRRAIEAADQQRAAPKDRADDATTTAQPDQTPNEIARGDRPRSIDPQQQETQSQGPAAANGAELPAFVRRHFVPNGDQFYYRDRPTMKAFRSGKDHFKADDVSQPVAKALVDLAEQRGWKSLKVKGTAEFKALVWAAAQEKGLTVDGYESSAGQTAAADAQSRPQERPQQPPSESTRTATPAQPEARERSPETPDRPPADPYTGEVVAYGPAPYRHQKDGSPSFRVKLRAEDGSEHEHWGVGLEDAMRDSRAKVGDQVRVARAGKRDVEIPNPDGTTRTVPRQDWRIEQLSSGPEVKPETAPKPEPQQKADAAPKLDARQEAIRQGIADKVADPEARDRAMKTAQQRLAEMQERLGQKPGQKPASNEVAAGRQRGAERER